MECHCGRRLKKDTNEKRGTVYKCPSCKCVYRFVIVHKSKECAEKERKEEMKSLKEYKREAGKRRKRK